MKIIGDTSSLKRVCQNILVDAASLIFISAALYFVSQAGLTLYSAFYQTQELPPPNAVSMATFQLSSAISSVFAVFFTRKYRWEKKENGKKEP